MAITSTVITSTVARARPRLSSAWPLKLVLVAAILAAAIAPSVLQPAPKAEACDWCDAVVSTVVDNLQTIGVATGVASVAAPILPFWAQVILAGGDGFFVGVSVMDWAIAHPDAVDWIFSPFDFGPPPLEVM